MGRRSRVSNNTIHGAMIHNRIAEQPTEAKCLRVRFSVARMRVRCGYALEIREEHRAWMLSRTRVKMFAQVHPRTGMQPRCNKGWHYGRTQWWCRGADFNRITRLPIDVIPRNYFGLMHPADAWTRTVNGNWPTSARASASTWLDGSLFTFAFFFFFSFL